MFQSGTYCSKKEQKREEGKAELSERALRLNFFPFCEKGLDLSRGSFIMNFHIGVPLRKTVKIRCGPAAVTGDEIHSQSHWGVHLPGKGSGE